MLQAERKPKTIIAIALILLTVLTLWSVRHIENILVGHTGQPMPIFTAIYASSFITLVWQTILYLLDKPKKIKAADQKYLNTLRVIVNVPVCNEDPDALRLCIASMLRQTRPIDVIHVVVNGPNKVDYTNVRRRVLRYAKKHGVAIYWDTQAIAGKRQAQARTIRDHLKPKDIFMTVDSDANLDSKAVEEGLKPLVDRDVMSVAGLVLNSNNRKALLTRLSDLWFLTAQLVDRASYSVLGTVLVNSGVLAFYRGHVVLDNLDSYLNETFFGRPMEFSDDSMLTLYALQKGRTVQQATSFSFTLMPEKLSHHLRQQVRWMRGSFIRSWWRFKYLPMNRYGYWGHLMKWVQMLLSSSLFLYLFIYLPIVDARILPYLLVIPVLIGYAQALQYFTIKRSDESFWYQLGTYLMLPLAAIWAFTVLRGVRWYAIATCLKTGWGTRQDVEVTA
jgi:hyaluronan synthase